MSSAEEPGHPYASSAMECNDYFISNYEYSYFDDDVVQEANGVLVESAAVAEAFPCNDDDDEDSVYDLLLSRPGLDNDTSSVATIETTALAQTVRFVLRCVGSGLVVEAAAPTCDEQARPSVVVCDAEEANVDAKTDCSDAAYDLSAEAHDEDGQERMDGVDLVPSTFKLFPRSAGLPTQEWTMVSTAKRGGDDGGAGRRGSCDASGSTVAAPSKVEFINMATRQRLVCAFDPDAASLWIVTLLTPHEYRQAKRAVAGFVRADAAWTLSSDGNILSSASGLALTDDGHGNLTVGSPSSHSLSVEQQWQLIPIV